MNKVTVELTGLSLKIRSAIDSGAADDGPDMDRIVSALEGSLDSEGVAIAFRRGLKLLVEREARALKREAMRRAEEDAARAAAPQRRAAAQQRAAEELAEVTAAHQELVAEQFFATWKETPTGRKFLGECTAEDLRYSGSRNLRRSESLRNAGEADIRLADEVERARCNTVRGLGYDRAAKAVAARQSH